MHGENFKDFPQLEAEWRDYLDHINAYYLLLSSALIKIDQFHLFRIHELTTRDAFSYSEFEDGTFAGEDVAWESFAEKHQAARRLSAHSSNMPLHRSPALDNRNVVEERIFQEAHRQFHMATSQVGAINDLATLTRAISARNSAIYDTSIVLAWFLVERVINYEWSSYLDEQQLEFADGSKRISKDRRDLLRGRDFTASILTNVMELIGKYDFETYASTSKIRGLRNKIAHGYDVKLTTQDAEDALALAGKMLFRRYGIQVATPEFRMLPQI